MTSEPDKLPDAPIRIQYVESAESFIEMLEQLPPLPLPFKRGQIVLYVAVVVLIPTLALVNRRDGEWNALGFLALPLVFFGFGLLVFFVYRSGGYLPLGRNFYRKSYRKKLGRESTKVVAEFGRDALFVSGEGAVATHIPWPAIHRVVERPKGVVVYETPMLIRWFPRTAFASQAEYAATVQFVHSKVANFERMV